MSAPDWVQEMRDSLKAGISTVSAPTLFVTPPDLARRVVDLAEIEPHHWILEPSAGTGALLDAIGDLSRTWAVELNLALVDGLRSRIPGVDVYAADFLEWEPQGPIDRVVMNPPFDRGADVKHIQHAYRMLAPGGRLVAICANGPRQRGTFMSEASEWIELPSGTFAGTSVRTVIVVLDD